MTGHNWKGDVVDFNLAPSEYGAIYFHDDDLEDAGWETDFELTIPENMRSGVYAARLRANDSEDYVPFFVRPKRGTSSAPIVFLAPTCSYLAYANFYGLDDPVLRGLMSELARREISPEPVQAQDRYIVDQNLQSLYDHHVDGAGVAYSSRLRPIVNMRPKYFFQTLALGQGAPTSSTPICTCWTGWSRRATSSTSLPTRTSTSRAPTS